MNKTIRTLENAIEDMDYEQQIAFTEFHILPDDFDEQDFYRMQSVLKARAPEDRPQDPMELLKQWGLRTSTEI